LKKILKYKLIFALFAQGRSPVHLAANNGHLHIVKYFVLECGADVNAQVCKQFVCQETIRHSKQFASQIFVFCLHTLADLGEFHVLLFVTDLTSLAHPMLKDTA
jgi:ankyrin repeat protein